MKKTILLFLLLPVFASAQNVNIPDAVFKAYLVGNSSINTNLDSEIQVSEATAFTGIINVVGDGISDLTGIEAFTSLNMLACSQNSLTTLDVSQNTTLTGFWCDNNSLTSVNVSNNASLLYFYCEYNLLTSLDVSGCTSLTDFGCDFNSLTSLDVSQNAALSYLECSSNPFTSLNVSSNTALTQLYCSNNSLTSLDVSNNTALTALWCNDNSLIGLDIRNGNNANMTWYGFTGNANLYCISVDDLAYSNANWSSDKDAWAIYSNDCTVGIEDNQLSQPSITSYNSTIQIKGKGTATIYNLQGQRVHQSKLSGNTSISLDKGIYLVRAISGNTSITKKVYLNN